MVDEKDIEKVASIKTILQLYTKNFYERSFLPNWDF